MKTQDPIKLRSLQSPQVDPTWHLFDWREHLDKLLDSPVSLNIRKNISVVFMLKQEIKRTLQEDPTKVKNKMIRSSLLYSKVHEPIIKNFIQSIPCFPNS